MVSDHAVFYRVDHINNPNDTDHGSHIHSDRIRSDRPTDGTGSNGAVLLRVYAYSFSVRIDRTSDIITYEYCCKINISIL